MTQINKDPCTKERMHHVYSLPSIKQSIRYFHAAASYPVKGMWIKAINVGNYVTCPGLTATAVWKHFPESDETQRGHMKQQWQGVRSKKIQATPITNPLHTQKKMKDMYIKIHNACNTMHMDQCGRFPATSNRENQYIMVLVEVDGNYVDA
jgi:hypothetical protein